MTVPTRVRAPLRDVGRAGARAAIREHLLDALVRHAGVVRRAALDLGMEIPHFYAALRRCGLTLADVDAIRPAAARRHGRRP